jgi:2-oxoglutarate dehydrogenase E2 component (dihydrolipoamide succinyltransferase)
VAVDEILCELESDKATFELPAEAAGILKIVGKEGDTLSIGAVICTIAQAGAGSAPQAGGHRKQAAPEAGASADKAYSEKHASPVAAKILAEKGIDPKDVNGSGSGGKIMKDDALKAEKAAPAAAAPAKPALLHLLRPPQPCGRTRISVARKCRRCVKPSRAVWLP